MKRSISSLAAAVLVSALSGCGMLDKSDNSGPTPPKLVGEDEEGTGCIQGIVTNGLTQGRVLLPQSNRNQGIRVIVRNLVKPAVTHTSNPDTDPAGNRLVGEYFLCGIPLNKKFPLVAQVDGYMDFEQEIRVNSHDEVSNTELTVPNETVNIVLYPQGVITQDLKITVVRDSVGVTGAQVFLRPTGKALFYDRKEKNPEAGEQPRTMVHSQLTDENGSAIFPADILIPGGQYSARVVPVGTEAGVAVEAEEFYVGVSSATSLTSMPYEHIIPIDRLKTTLAIRSTSVDHLDFNPDGSISILFNQAVEIVPGSENNLLATLSIDGGGTFYEPEENGAVLLKDNRDTPASDTVNLVRDENNPKRLVLSPQWARKPSSARANEKDLMVRYSGLMVRAVGSHDVRERVNVADVTKLSVRLYEDLP